MFIARLINLCNKFFLKLFTDILLSYRFFSNSLYIYICMYRERERERDTDRQTDRDRDAKWLFFKINFGILIASHKFENNAANENTLF